MRFIRANDCQKTKGPGTANIKDIFSETQTIHNTKQITSVAQLECGRSYVRARIWKEGEIREKPIKLIEIVGGDEIIVESSGPETGTKRLFLSDCGVLPYVGMGCWNAWNWLEPAD